MVHFWRVRFGEVVINRKSNYDHLFDLCKKQTPSCIAVGWGEIDLSENLDEIKQRHVQKYPGEKIDLNNIQNWIAMEEGDLVIAMKRPAIICAIGEITRATKPSGVRYRTEAKDFILELVGGPGHSVENPYRKVKFFNRMDVTWIPSTEKYIKVRSLGLPKHTENILYQIPTIIKIERNDYNLIREKIDAYEPEESPSPSKFKREYDNYSKSGR